MPAYEEILAKAGVKDAEVAFVGDDLPDIPILKRVGLAVAVGDAVADVKKNRALHHQSPRRKGRHPRSHRTHPKIQRHLGRTHRQSPRLMLHSPPHVLGGGALK